MWCEITSGSACDRDPAIACGRDISARAARERRDAGRRVRALAGEPGCIYVEGPRSVPAWSREEKMQNEGKRTMSGVIDDRSSPSFCISSHPFRDQSNGLPFDLSLTCVRAVSFFTRGSSLGS